MLSCFQQSSSSFSHCPKTYARNRADSAPSNTHKALLGRSTSRSPNVNSSRVCSIQNMWSLSLRKGVTCALLDETRHAKVIEVAEQSVDSALCIIPGPYHVLSCSTRSFPQLSELSYTCQALQSAPLSFGEQMRTMMKPVGRLLFGSLSRQQLNVVHAVIQGWLISSIYMLAQASYDYIFAENVVRRFASVK